MCEPALPRFGFCGPRAKSGIVAVEFSLLAPVLVMLLLGVVESCRALLAYRNVAQMTESLAWTTQTLVAPATSTANSSLPTSAKTVLDNIIFVMQGATAPSNLTVSVRYLAKSMTSGSISETVLYKTTTAPTANNAGISTNMMNGDTRIVAQSVYVYNLLIGVSVSLSSRYSL
ncbi:MAG TPA: TadE/TadG family type IV pilus assembly protein [Methylosinus sp.]|jgi:Flp pilus assembly protein TadG|uniref:TadE/TadG family type IV pilus assembly protein n=1 Tax=Methylosinus sp. TaxID=427 RepID=UPI002F946370